MLLRPIGDGTLAYSASLGGVLRLLGCIRLGFGAWDCCQEDFLQGGLELRPVVISDIQYRPMVGVELDHVTEWTLIRHDYNLNSQ